MAKKVLRYTEEEFVTLLENIVKKVKAEEALNENFIRFDNHDNNQWRDMEDRAYQELPDGEYEDKEYFSYDEFASDFPEHKHFMGNKPENLEGSRGMFDKYKRQFGPLKGKLNRPNLGENRTNPKKPLNERYSKLK